MHHFAWVKSQAIPSKILNVIGLFCSSFLPFALASKACLVFQLVSFVFEALMYLFYRTIIVFLSHRHR